MTQVLKLQDVRNHGNLGNFVPVEKPLRTALLIPTVLTWKSDDKGDAYVPLDPRHPLFLGQLEVTPLQVS